MTTDTTPSGAAGPRLGSLARGDGESVAYAVRPARARDPAPGAGGAPGVLFLSGFRSDMNGNKARALDAWAEARGHGLIRFDYFGHGASSGDFRRGTIGRWLADTLAILDQVATGPQVLVGSSMGGWLALLAARARPARVRGLVLVAPAPDFTERLMWPGLPPEAREAILARGEWMAPSAYGEDPYPITADLIREGREHLILDGPIAFAGPVRILQGMADPDVPWTHALDLVQRLSGDVVASLIRDGDHRLSRPEDLRRLETALDEVMALTREPAEDA